MLCERKEEGSCLHLNSPGGGLATVAGLSLGLLSVATPASQAAVYHCPTSHVCVHSDNYFRGAQQTINGHSHYTNLNGQLHDKASSWINANRYAYMQIGEWHNSRMVIGQTLPPGWYENNLGRNASFNDRADWVKHDWYRP